MFTVDVKKLRSRTLVGLAHSGDYTLLSDTYTRLFETLDARDLTDKTRQMVAIFYDNPAQVPVANLRSFAGVTAPKTVPADAPLLGITLPTGRHAVLRFTGDYAGLPAAYAYLYTEWLAKSGETLSSHPSYEVYLNSPRDTPAAELVTEICQPLI
jgi:AraC family transcriptional regulator